MLAGLEAGPGSVVVRPGRLLLDNGPQPGTAVLLREGKFAEIGAADAVAARNPGTRVVELPQHLMMPPAARPGPESARPGRSP